MPKPVSKSFSFFCFWEQSSSHSTTKEAPSFCRYFFRHINSFLATCVQTMSMIYLTLNETLKTILVTLNTHKGIKLQVIVAWSLNHKKMWFHLNQWIFKKVTTPWSCFCIACMSLKYIWEYQSRKEYFFISKYKTTWTNTGYTSRYR